MTTLAFGHTYRDASSSRVLTPLLASGHYNGDIYLWHGDSGQLITRLISHKGPVHILKNFHCCIYTICFA